MKPGIACQRNRDRNTNRYRMKILGDSFSHFSTTTLNWFSTHFINLITLTWFAQTVFLLIKCAVWFWAQTCASEGRWSTCHDFIFVPVGNIKHFLSKFVELCGVSGQARKGKISQEIETIPGKIYKYHWRIPSESLEKFFFRLTFQYTHTRNRERKKKNEKRRLFFFVSGVH